MPPNLFTFLRPALLALALVLAVSTTYAQTNERLKLDRSPHSQKIEVEGVVSSQNKYSIDIDVDGEKKNIKVEKRTQVILVCASPKIDFEKSILTIFEKGSNRKHRSYNFSAPLFVRAAFAHKKQYQRFIDSAEKRIGNFEISKQPFEKSSGKRQIFLDGKLMPGPSVRKQTIETDKEKFEILLAKHGQWHGFSLSELTAQNTSVRVTGFESVNNEITADRIWFWPTNTLQADDSN